MFKINDKVKILRAKNSCWNLYPAPFLIGEVGMVKKYREDTKSIRVEILTGRAAGKDFCFDVDSKALIKEKTIRKIV